MTLSEKWARFERDILLLAGVEIGDVQHRETRRAWYAGAAAMFGLLVNLAGPDDEPDEIGAERVERVNQELQRWMQALEAGEV